MNDGKSLERDFKKSCQDQGIWVLRIKDTFYRATLNDKQAFVPKQPCDFITHFHGVIQLIECKSTQYKSITIERDGSKGMIKQSQYDSMRRAVGPHEVAGFIIQFQTGTDDQRTYYWSVENFFEYLNSCDKKSCNELDVVQYGGMIIEQTKIRVNYKYNIAGLFNKIIKEKEENNPN